MYCVYKLTDKNGLVYYGSTDNPSIRLTNHRSTGDQSCSRKMDRYSIKMDIMEEDIATKQEALWRERFYFDNNECINENKPITSEEEKKDYMKVYQKKYHKEYQQRAYVKEKQRAYDKAKTKNRQDEKDRVYFEHIKEKQRVRKLRNKEIKLMGLEDKYN